MDDGLDYSRAVRSDSPSGSLSPFKHLSSEQHHTVCFMCLCVQPDNRVAEDGPQLSSLQGGPFSGVEGEVGNTREQEVGAQNQRNDKKREKEKQLD